MKKFLTILFAIVLIILTSCGKSNNSSVQPTTDEPSTTITAPSDDVSTTKRDEPEMLNWYKNVGMYNGLMDRKLFNELCEKLLDN